MFSKSIHVENERIIQALERGRDINYIKGIPRISNKPKSQKQLEQQYRRANGRGTLAVAELPAEPIYY